MQDGAAQRGDGQSSVGRRSVGCEEAEQCEQGQGWEGRKRTILSRAAQGKESQSRAGHGKEGVTQGSEAEKNAHHISGHGADKQCTVGQ